MSDDNTRYRVFGEIHEADDPRQSLSRAKLVAARAWHEARGAKVNVIPMDGFAASNVNLGWLQDEIEEYWRQHRPTSREMMTWVVQDIELVVQRLKDVRVRWRDESAARLLLVSLTTKDDHGVYEYEFAARLPA
jgi:hypothetical protein